MHKNIPTMLFDRVSQSGNTVSLRYKDTAGGEFKDTTWSRFADLVTETAFGLLELELEHQSAAAILAPNSHLWLSCDLAILSCGAFSVPIYPSCSVADIEHILKSSQASVVFVGGEHQLNKLLSIRSRVPDLNKIVLLPPLTIPRADAETGLFITLEQLRKHGKKYREHGSGAIEKRIAGLQLEDIATVIYTSGTTGAPKGAVLTHRNILALLDDAAGVIPIGKDDVYLSFLPLSHVFERVCGEFYWIYTGQLMAISESVEAFARNFVQIQPTLILVVPRVLDRIYQKIQGSMQDSPLPARKLIEWAVEVGYEIVDHISAGKPLSIYLKVKHMLAEKAVLKKLRTKIGSRLRLIVSGGAPATPQVIKFFNAVGIATLEGYGLTETTAPLAVNRASRVKPGTVGPKLPSVSIKLAPDGEILVRGPTIFPAYYHDESATRAAFGNGWFATGDIGAIDEDGYITITDRKKDLIVSSAGKNIAPQRLESMLKQIPVVFQAAVFGDRQKHLVALLMLDEPATTELARRQGWKYDGYHGLLQSPELHQYLHEEVKSLNRQLSDHERIRRFALLPEDLSIESGELTATLKVKRKVIAEKYRNLIDSCYQEQETPALSGAR